MINSPRSVLSNSQNQRLHFPLPGDFGYEEPVGRKKLRPKQSAIHKIIFNHDLEDNPSKQYHSFEHHSRLDMYDPQKQYLNNIRKQKHMRSPITNIDIYGMQEHSGSNSSREQQFRSNNSQHYPMTSSKVIEETKRRGHMFKVDSTHLKRRDNSEGSSKMGGFPSADSLDNLVSSAHSKEKMLDSIIRMRLKNPTFINSQL